MRQLETKTKQVNKKINPAMPLRDQESVEKLLNTVTKARSYHQVLEYVQNEIQENTRITSFDYKIACYMKDGAYALSRAVEGKIGFTKQKDRESASGKNPPIMLDVTFADGRSVKVPWGTINLPAFGKDAFIEMQYDGINMHLRGQCEKRFLNDLDQIVKETRHLLETDSIYKGQALKFIPGAEPEFIDLSNIEKTPIFLTPAARFSTEPIEARIEKTEECIAQGVDIRLGVLLEGPYGGGKTLYAFKIAKKATENGWTFVYNSNPEDTLEAMKMAQSFCKNGKGVVLFTEDIDKVLDKRDDYTNEISLLMDGGESKNKNVISIFTTNHIEKIEPTFLRGKRIGSIVSLTAPDAVTAEAMLKNLLGDSIEGSVKKVAKKMAELEIVPAFIAEICDKVKAHRIFSGKEKVVESDIFNAVEGYQRQMEIARLKEATETPAESLAKSLHKVISFASEQAIDETREEVIELKAYVQDNF